MHNNNITLYKKIKKIDERGLTITPPIFILFPHNKPFTAEAVNVKFSPTSSTLSDPYLFVP